MKLRCNNCGEVVESGLVNITNHVFEVCKAAKTEKINEMFSMTIRPFANFTPIEKSKK